MAIYRIERIFSYKSKEKDNTKLKTYDKINIGMHKYLEPSFERKLLIKGDDPRASREEHRKAALTHAAGYPIIDAGLGTAAGAIIGGKGHRGKGALYGAGYGALLGTSMAAGELMGKKLRYEARRAHPDSKLAKEADRQTDQIRVADGQMTKAEFAKKWYK